MNARDAVAGTALLLAAHGERRPGTGNDGVFRIAGALAERGLVSEVAVGFINGVPSIGDALEALKASRIIVYPLFASSGYFTRDRLVQLIDEADREGRDVRILPPLGLDPGLPQLVTALVKRTAREHGLAAHRCTVIFLAHGSRRNSASREATEQIAREVEASAVFRKVRIAFLEERPFLGEAAADAPGPAVVVGLFSGEGMHGASDAPRLIAELGRDNVVFAGVVGSMPGIENLVARTVAEALLQDVRRSTPRREPASGLKKADFRDRRTTREAQCSEACLQPLTPRATRPCACLQGCPSCFLFFGTISCRLPS